MSIKLPIILEKDEGNTIIASCPIFKGSHTFGENSKELESNINEMTSMYFEMAKEGNNVFSGDNIVFLNFDENGKITDNFSKEINKDFRKTLS